MTQSFEIVLETANFPVLHYRNQGEFAPALNSPDEPFRPSRATVGRNAYSRTTLLLHVAAGKNGAPLFLGSMDGSNMSTGKVKVEQMINVSAPVSFANMVGSDSSTRKEEKMVGPHNEGDTSIGVALKSQNFGTNNTTMDSITKVACTIFEEALNGVSYANTSIHSNVKAVKTPATNSNVDAPSTYASKISPSSSNKANLPIFCLQYKHHHT